MAGDGTAFDPGAPQKVVGAPATSFTPERHHFERSSQNDAFATARRVLWTAVMLNASQQPTVVRPELINDEGRWVVRVDRGNGKVQEYRCASEEQARQLVAVLAPVN
jgi:hypothetical protein